MSKKTKNRRNSSKPAIQLTRYSKIPPGIKLREQYKELGWTSEFNKTWLSRVIKRGFEYSEQIFHNWRAPNFVKNTHDLVSNMERVLKTDKDASNRLDSVIRDMIIQVQTVDIMRDYICKRCKNVFIEEQGLYDFLTGIKIPSTSNFRDIVSESILEKIDGNELFATFFMGELGDVIAYSDSDIGKKKNVTHQEIVSYALDSKRYSMMIHIPNRHYSLMATFTSSKWDEEKMKGLCIGRDQKSTDPIGNRLLDESISLNTFLNNAFITYANEAGPGKDLFPSACSMNQVTLDWLNSLKNPDQQEKDLKFVINLLFYMSQFKNTVKQGLPQNAAFDTTQAQGKKNLKISAHPDIVFHTGEGTSKTTHFRGAHFKHLVSDHWTNKKGQWVFTKSTVVNREHGNSEILTVE